MENPSETTPMVPPEECASSTVAEESWLAKAFYVDCSRRDDMTARMTCCPLLKALPRDRKQIGPHDACSEASLKKKLQRLYDFDEYNINSAILLIKIGLSLYASGMPTYALEPVLQANVASFGLPPLRLAQGYRHLQVSFGGGAVLHFASKQGKVLHRLSMLHKVSIATAVAAGKIDSRSALTCVDQVMERRAPYGKAIELLAHLGFSTAASIAIFGGNLDDLQATAVAKVSTMALVAVMSSVPVLAVQTDLLEPLVAGFVAPLISTSLFGFNACHAATTFLSVMVIEFPGADLLFGVTELKRGTGAAMVGATRLFLAVIYTMFLAVSLAIGWTLSAGIVTHTNPGMFNASAEFWKPWPEQCTDLHYDGWTCGWTDIGYNVAALVPLVICFSVIVGTHLSEMPLPGVCILLTLLLSYTLGNLGLPVVGPVLNTAVLFVGANFAFMYEYLTGKSHMLVLVPVIALLAPGATVFKNVLKSIDSVDGGGSAWFSMLMVGVSYAVGDALAHHLWAPLLLKKQVERAENTANMLSTVQHACPTKRKRLMAESKRDRFSGAASSDGMSEEGLSTVVNEPSY